MVAWLKNDIDDEVRKKPLLQATWVSAKESHTKEALDYFNDHFKLVEGEYTLEVAVWNDDTPLAQVAYDVELHAGQIDALRSATEEYKWGKGLGLDGRVATVGVQLRKPVPAK